MGLKNKTYSQSRRPWSSPLSHLQCRGDFLKPTRQATLLAGEAGFPRPPPAAPAAGGRGNHVSRLVHSVGLGRCSAGGGVEVAVLLVRVLLSGCFLSGVGGPRSSGAASPTSPASRIRGSAESLVPCPDPCRRRVWIPNKLWKTTSRRFATEVVVQGVGSPEPLSGDFPLAMGLAPLNQGLRSSGSGAPPARSALRQCRDPDVEEGGLGCNSSFSLDLSVRANGLI